MVADACGSMSTLADEATFDRPRANGAVVTVGNQAPTSRFIDFSAAEGQQATQINLQEAMSKLGKQLSQPAGPDAERAGSGRPLPVPRVAHATGIRPAATKGFDPDM